LVGCPFRAAPGGKPEGKKKKRKKKKKKRKEKEAVCGFLWSQLGIHSRREGSGSYGSLGEFPPRVKALVLMT
jgi:hypothetical protein